MQSSVVSTRRGRRRVEAGAKSLLGVGLTALVLTHLGYPLGIRVAAWFRRRPRGRRRPRSDESVLPRVTVVVPALDEERFLHNKLLNTLQQDYPSELLDVLVVDDGSTDRTAEIARAFAPRVRLLQQPQRQGKVSAINRGVSAAEGDVVVLTDANGSLEAGSLAALVAPFADDRVAVVGAIKRPQGTGSHGQGEAAYWQLENGLRRAESAYGSVVGVDGGAFAVRRAAFEPIPHDVFADDYWVSLNALSRGFRVVHSDGACAVEAVSESKIGDFERRTRIAAGIWRESLAHLHLVDPRRGGVAVAFTLHRVMRTAVVPVLLPLLVPAAFLAGRSSPPFKILAWAQAACWAAAGIGAATDAQVLALPYQFALTNVAAVRGGARLFARRQSALWKQTERGPWL